MSGSQIAGSRCSSGRLLRGGNGLTAEGVSRRRDRAWDSRRYWTGQEWTTLLIAEVLGDIAEGISGCIAGGREGAEYGALVLNPEAGGVIGCAVGAGSSILLGADVADPQQRPP